MALDQSACMGFCRIDASLADGHPRAGVDASCRCCMVAVRQSQPGAIHPILVRQSCSGESSIKDLRLLCNQAVHILLLLGKILLLLLRLHILRVWVLLWEIG